jgi:hypothetical protein
MRASHTPGGIILLMALLFEWDPEKARTTEADWEMPEEIDFSGGTRNPYAERYAEGTNVVLLDPDVMDVFPDSESVNSALRALAKLIRAQAKAA